MTPLHLASWGGDENVVLVEVLLDANADINSKDKVSRILCVYMCPKLCWCFWMMFCCCIWELFINIQCFLFYSPPFFFSFLFFFFFFRLVRLLSILLL